MQNISGYGANVTLIASNTFPLGLTINQFADDSDPIEIEELQVGDSAMGLNGDLITWSTANPLNLTLNVVPLSASDISLSILLEANRVGRGKIGARDIITLNVLYPSGSFVTFSNGIITNGSPANSVASSGRLNSKSYNFTFEGRSGV